MFHNHIAQELISPSINKKLKITSVNNFENNKNIIVRICSYDYPEILSLQRFIHYTDSANMTLQPKSDPGLQYYLLSAISFQFMISRNWFAPFLTVSKIDKGPISFNYARSKSLTNSIAYVTHLIKERLKIRFINNSENNKNAIYCLAICS